jgi:hypothetical protein
MSSAADPSPSRAAWAGMALVSPALLGALSDDPNQARDRFSSAFLLATAGRRASGERNCGGGHCPV